jgi:hypothetical protein
VTRQKWAVVLYWRLTQPIVRVFETEALARANIWYTLSEDVSDGLRVTAIDDDRWSVANESGYLRTMHLVPAV